MKKLNENDIKKIVGGAGKQPSGAYLSGIGGIINAVGNLFATVVGTVVNAIHSFTDKPHLKADYKFGSTSISYDDTKKIDLEKEMVKQQNLQHVVKVKPMVSHDFNQVEVQNHNLELVQNLEVEPQNDFLEQNLNQELETQQEYSQNFDQEHFQQVDNFLHEIF